MKFYCVISNEKDKSLLLIKESAQKLGLEFVPVQTKTFNFSNFRPDEEKHIVYRVAMGKLARAVERTLINEHSVTFYKTYNRAMSFIEDENLIYKKSNLPIPKTIDFLVYDKDLLREYVEYLGGFPIIIKSLGGSHGVGVMRVDSFDSLFSVSNYILKNTTDQVVLKEYIDFDKHARLIVLGDRVVDSIEYKRSSDDFRTNAGKDLNVTAYKFSDDVEQTAIKAVEAVGVEFAGVDILIKGDQHYIAEANFPCFFPRCQEITGTNISDMMVKYLLDKSNG